MWLYLERLCLFCVVPLAKLCPTVTHGLQTCQASLSLDLPEFAKLSCHWVLVMLPNHLISVPSSFCLFVVKLLVTWISWRRRTLSPNDWRLMKRRRHLKYTQGRDHVRMEAETDEACSSKPGTNSSGCQQPPEAKTSQEQLCSPEPQRNWLPAASPISDSGLWEQEKVNFCYFETTELCWLIMAATGN